MTPATNCAVTGASGYLGSRLAAALERDGSRVLRLSRAPGPDGAPYTLAGGVPDGFFRDRGVTALVHCAWDFTLTKREDIFRQNAGGSVRLLEQAHAEGVKRIVFVSTISAFDGCRSLYGQSKLAVEAVARRLGAVVVRPGLVYGDNPGGMVGALDGAVRRLPLIPLIGSGRQVVYPAHEDDVARLVVALIDGDASGGGSDAPVIAASERGWTLRQMLAALAAAQGRRARPVPVPWPAVWLPLRLAEAVGLRPGFRSDSVISIVNQDPRPDFGSLRATGVAFRDFAPAGTSKADSTTRHRTTEK